MRAVVKSKEELEKEVLELRAMRCALEERTTVLEDRASKLEIERDYLKFQNDKLRRLLFGHRSEKLPARDDGLEQLDLFKEAETEVQDAELEETEETETRKRRRSKRRPIPKDIHREQLEVDVDPRAACLPRLWRRHDVHRA